MKLKAQSELDFWVSRIEAQEASIKHLEAEREQAESQSRILNEELEKKRKKSAKYSIKSAAKQAWQQTMAALEL